MLRQYTLKGHVVDDIFFLILENKARLALIRLQICAFKVLKRLNLPESDVAVLAAAGQESDLLTLSDD